MSEIELKFELAPEAHAAFRRLAPLAEGESRTERLHALYFDTPDFDLRRHAMALRLRRERRRWVQCLKAGTSGAGGLHAREEWEFDRPQASIDVSLLAKTPFAREPELGEHLGEIFQVDVRRTTWELEVSPGNRVEVALDRGEVSRAGEHSPISEVEIESVSGDPMAVFELAERLVGSAPLRPSSITKAQRGYRLASGENATPTKARPVELGAAWSTSMAARAVVAAALEQLQANEAGVIESADPEYLHQYRVALRRLRSALRVFRDALEPAFVQEVSRELKWIAALTGPARDWDVLATHTLPAILSAWSESRSARSVRARVALRRRASRDALREALASPRYARVVLALARWLATSIEESAQQTASLGEFAARVVSKRHRKLLAGARRLSALPPAERHQLRLEAKRLRYALDGFETLFRHSRLGAYRELLAEIQDDLGRANDAAVATRLLADLKPPGGLAQFARGWLGAQTHSSVELLGRHAARLADAKLPRLKT
jgi:inorganic triphosphatase YgiF